MSKSISSSQIGIQSFNEPSFTVVNEYDPLWPNDYQKVIQGMCIYIVWKYKEFTPNNTVWKFQDSFVTDILREINFGLLNQKF